MKPEIKKLWTDALRSGEYKQIQLMLHSRDGFCCLGVLCDLAIKQGLDLRMDRIENLGDGHSFFAYDDFGSGLPPKVWKWAGLDQDCPSCGCSMDEASVIPFGEDGDDLATLNDTGASFREIADIIEQHL